MVMPWQCLGRGTPRFGVAAGCPHSRGGADPHDAVEQRGPKTRRGPGASVVRSARVGASALAPRGARASALGATHGWCGAHASQPSGARATPERRASGARVQAKVSVRVRSLLIVRMWLQTNMLTAAAVACHGHRQVVLRASVARSMPLALRFKTSRTSSATDAVLCGQWLHKTPQSYL